MQRQASCCDFCGFPEIAQQYPTDTEGISWFACLGRARLIDHESWNLLMERGAMAWAKLRPLSDEMYVLRGQVEQLV